MTAVVLNPAEHRYELEVDGALAVAAFEDDGPTRVFTHTMVPPPLRGRGIASRLIAGALDDARAAGLRVDPACPFVERFIAARSDYQDLVA